MLGIQAGLGEQPLVSLPGLQGQCNERMFGPLKMKDTGFHVPAANASRLAEAFAKDPLTGAANVLIDVSKVPGNDSGGAGGVGTAINTTTNPGQLLLGTNGYTFGLGFLVRSQDGIAPVHGSAGEFMWAGFAGTFFWAEPKEKLCADYMTQSPSPLRASYRRLMKNLVSQAIVN